MKNYVKCPFCDARFSRLNRSYALTHHLDEAHNTHRYYAHTDSKGDSGAYDGRCNICGVQYKQKPGWWSSGWVLYHLHQLPPLELKRHLVQIALTGEQ